MCRWIVYFSRDEPILLADVVLRPAHSLVKQVDQHFLPGLQVDPAPQQADDVGGPNNLSNLDGFGLGWYSSVPSDYGVFSHREARVRHPELLPTVYKCLQSPWHDLNLHSIANAVESQVVFGHLRAAGAVGSVSMANCHPFQFGRFLVQQNGRIGGLEDIRIDLMSIIPKRPRERVKGTTDTEWLAALFFHYLDPDPEATYLESYPLSSQLSALRRTFSTIINLTEIELGYYDRASSSTTGARRRLALWFSANVAISDGSRFIALRFAYPPKDREAPSLYWSETAGSALDRRYTSHPDDGGLDVGRRPRASRSGRHVVVASEPMTFDHGGEWSEVVQGQLVLVDEDGKVELRNFDVDGWEEIEGSDGSAELKELTEMSSPHVPIRRERPTPCPLFLSPSIPGA
ncbi:hypothetical protein JCM10212_006628 [Sporobolomyces blumeae]